MTATADERFFTALKRACDEIEDLDETCRAAVDRALESKDVVDFRNARIAIDALETAKKDAVLRRAHWIMATDISAIWDQLPNAKQDQKPN